MSRAGNTAVYANITQADLVRLRRLLDGQSLNAYLRSLISTDLEDLEEAPLEPLIGGPQHPARPRRPLPHGTLSRYNHRGCRCDACSEARRAYVRTWKNAGACTTL